MLNTFYTYLKEGAIYYGLEVSENLGVVNYYLLGLRKKKQELILTHELTFTDLKEISEKYLRHRK